MFNRDGRELLNIVFRIVCQMFLNMSKLYLHLRISKV